jgi:hypothetical protein
MSADNHSISINRSIARKAKINEIFAKIIKRFESIVDGYIEDMNKKVKLFDTFDITDSINTDCDGLFVDSINNYKMEYSTYLHIHKSPASDRIFLAISLRECIFNNYLAKLERESAETSNVSINNIVSPTVGETTVVSPTIVSPNTEPIRPIVSPNTEPIRPIVSPNTEPIRPVVSPNTEPNRPIVSPNTEPIRPVVSPNTEPIRPVNTNQTPGINSFASFISLNTAQTPGINPFRGGRTNIHNSSCIN